MKHGAVNAGAKAMNNHLEAFRKRLKEPEKERINWQFWIGSPTAWIALRLSSVTAFYTFVYHSDKLSVVFNDVELRRNYNSDTVELRSPQSAIFVNSGNSSVAVIGITATVIQPLLEGVPPSCLDRAGLVQDYEFEFEQTVVKPYETVSKSLKFANKNSWQDRHLVELTSVNKAKEEYEFAVCVTFKLVTQEASDWRKSLDLGFYRLRGDGLVSRLQQNPVERPRYLINKSMFWRSE